MTLTDLSTDTIRAVSSVREVVCGLRSDLFSRYCVAVLKAFVDDSGSDGNSSEWYVLAGYIGTIDGWDGFDELWDQVLHAHPRIEYFKSSEAESLKGEFSGFTREQSNSKIDGLIQVIKRCARRSFCVRLRQRDYDEIVKGNVPEKWDSPYYFLFVVAIGAAINIERIDGDNEEIDFVFDRDDKHQHRFDLTLPKLNGMSSIDGKFVNAVRRDAKKFLPLQAADLIAWQTRRFCQSDGGPAREHFYTARDCPPKKNELFILDRRELFNIMCGIRETAADIAKSMQCPSDVREWKP